MQVLRRSTFLARLILAWFVLSLGVAVASPLVKPQDAQWVCSGSGMLKVLVSADTDDSGSVSNATLDCPLCLSAALLPLPDAPFVAPIHPLAYALQGIPAAILAARTAAPLPARGPPRLA
ncbi:MAG: DUF2946 family protein [Rhodoferax sp.]